MMEVLTNLIQQVTDKALEFKQKTAELEVELHTVKLALNENQTQLSQSKAENVTLQAELERHMNNQPENSLTTSSDEVLNERIDALVKEIDACLALLK